MPSKRKLFNCGGCKKDFRVKRKNQLNTTDGVINMCNNCYITFGGVVPRLGRFSCSTCKNNDVRSNKGRYCVGQEICKGCVPKCERCNEDKWDWICGPCYRETGQEY